MAHFDGTTWTPSPLDTTESLRGLRLFDSGELAFGSKMHRVYLRGLEVPDGGTDATSDGGLVERPGDSDRLELPV